MKLCIADPPYPPQFAERRDLADGSVRVTTRSRATRWYGGQTWTSGFGRHADAHPDASEWDDPARHRALLEQLMDEYDGWAIATCPDGLDHYRPLPIPAQLYAWFKTNSMRTGGRAESSWEPIIVYTPEGRRARTPGQPQVRDVVRCSPNQAAGHGFVGAKPAEWTRLVLDGLGYDPEVDELTDLFPGSGAVTAAAAQGVLL